MKLIIKLAIILFGLSRLTLASEIASHIIKIDGSEIHYYKTGKSGTPLVLLTGYATTSNFWNKNFINCLAETHQVFLLDYQGIGTGESVLDNLSINSMANNVNLFVKQLKLRDTSLVGWSMGGGIALQASFAEPKLYKHLYLLSSIVPRENRQLLKPVIKPAFHSDSDIMNYVFGRNIYNYESINLLAEENKFIYNKNLFPDTAIIKLQRKAIDNWIRDLDVVTELKNGIVPATFYLPANDKIIDEDIARSVIKNYPKATVMNIKNSGHNLSWQYPDMICKDILVNN